MRKAVVLLSLLIIPFLATDANAAENIEVEPKDLFIRSSAGTMTRETVLIKNRTSSILDLTLDWKSYEPPGKQYNGEQTINKHSINFASLSTDKLTLQPYGVDKIEIEFDIPKTTKAADYYGTLLINSKEQTTFTVRIAGKLIEDVSIANFSNDGTTLNLTLVNNGNQTTTLKGKVEIRDFFGKITNLDLEKTDLKADERKTLQLNHNNLLPGPYQAKISLDYGSQDNRLEFYSSWVHPEIFLIGGAVIIIVAFILWYKPRKRR